MSARDRLLRLLPTSLAAEVEGAEVAGWMVLGDDERGDRDVSPDPEELAAPPDSSGSAEAARCRVRHIEEGS